MNYKDGPHIVRIAALIGDHARAEILTSLMADQALTATELAERAGVTKQTISAHLAKLLEAHLVAVATQGRHRYYRLADRDVATLLETLMGVAFRAGAVRLKAGPREPALRHARVCYDHLVGELGVFALEQLQQRGVFSAASFGAELALTTSGEQWCTAQAINLDGLRRKPRPLCLACLDWSERRYHLSGALGAALLVHILAKGWATRQSDSRVVSFSPNGEAAFREWLA